MTSIRQYCPFKKVIKYEPEDFISIIKTGFFYQSINIIVNMLFTHLFVALYFVCIVWFIIIGDCPFIASDKCTQKYAHCIVLCGLRNSGLYNVE